MASVMDKLFVRTDHVCPWWFCWTFDNAARKMVHNPYRILAPFINKGDTVMDVGCGMGYFSIAMADMVGVQGSVVAVDLQTKMLERVRQRAEKRGVVNRITLQKASLRSLGIEVKATFALAFWMMHEVPDRDRLLNEIYKSLREGGKLLIVEPMLHVSTDCFNETLKIAVMVGFKNRVRRNVFLSQACVMEKCTTT